MNVATWLRELGLECYAQAFEDNDVDAQTLRQLSETDLAEIGVALVGHRRKLANAIAALAGGPSTAAVAAPPATPRGEAERRQLSVLYCEMVWHAGNPERRMDPEERRGVIQSFHKTCIDVVVGYDGHVANFYGDCLLAYFGWPRAHEDDAERAVLAGLTLARQVHALRSGLAVRARVGVATGAVVVGDLIHEGPAQEQSAVGLTPNLAARLLSLAAPEQVVIDGLTRRLLSPSFSMQSLGSHALKGIGEPVAAYAVRDERAADSRFDARKGHDLAPMVGRGTELALMTQHWAQACAGEGTAVLLVGEAGIGKSRITRALLDHCAAQPHRQVRWQCSPHHTGSALWPVIQRLERAAELGTQDSDDAALDKLETLTGRSKEATALYATLLGLNGTQRYGPLELTPQMLRERTLELLVEQLFELAEQCPPLLLVVEDAHWIDPTTLELIGRCLERIVSARMLMLITSRPDNQPALAAHPSVMRLSLNRLGNASVEAIVAQLGGQSLQAQTLASIVAQTDGVPLFVEELTKAVLETGEAAIPASLHGSLMARLDRIPEAKEVAQIAACIGREFDQALLQEVVAQPAAVGPALEKLTVAELVFRRSGEANARFTFKHALVQEAARESLLRSKRRHIHARILAVLEAQRPDTPQEILAHHAARAQQADKAIGYWQRAGDAALAKSAYVEAAAHFDSAIALVRDQTDGADRRGRELELQLRLGEAHMAGRGYAAEATGNAFARACELVRADSADPARSLRALRGMWFWHLSRGEAKKALELGREALATAQAGGDQRTLLFAIPMVGATQAFMGDFAGARIHLERAVSLETFTQPPAQLAAPLGVDPAVSILSSIARISCIEGLAQQSAELSARARRMALALPQANARFQLHFDLALTAVLARESVTSQAEIESLREMAAKHRLSVHKGSAECLRAWVAMEFGKHEEAVAKFERGLAHNASIGSHLYKPFFESGLASALAACGRHQDAMRAIEGAVAECEKFALGLFDAELWRVRGELLLLGPQPDPVRAIGCFDKAMSIARARGAKLWELRAAVSLARLRAEQGEHAEARALLAPIHASFTEGFESADFSASHALLGELARCRPGGSVGH